MEHANSQGQPRANQPQKALSLIGRLHAVGAVRALPLALLCAALLAFGTHWVLRPRIPGTSSFVGTVEEEEDGVGSRTSDETYHVPLTVLDGGGSGGGDLGDGVCLDGSPPAYHLSPGSGNGMTKWLVFLEGGGWCTSLEDCESRAHTALGSSAFMRRTFHFDGILANSSSKNPPFFDWNRVYVRYCDGASFAGTAGEVQVPRREGVGPALDVELAVPRGSVQVQRQRVHFRGQRVFERVMRHLLVERGMGHATHALLAGCSAGGLASALHCQQFRQLFDAGLARSKVPGREGKGEETTGEVDVKCLSDGGFFMDVQDVFGGRALRDMYSAVVSLQKPALSQKCLRSSLKGTQQQKSLDLPTEGDPTCFFPENVLPHTSTPFYILNSVYDNWCIDFAFAPVAKDLQGEWSECRRNLKTCSRRQMSLLNGFRDHMISLVKNISRGGNPSSSAASGLSGDGAFLLGCHIHCQTLWSNTWHGRSTPRIQGKTLAEAVGGWYTGVSKPSLLADCKFPCNPTCYNWYSR